MSPQPRRIWSDVEKAILRAAYGREPLPAIRAKLPGRTDSMINNQVARLGLGKSRRYTSRDDEIIRQMWGAVHISVIAERLGRDPIALTQYARTKLQLPMGVPQGHESIVGAARRCNFSPSTMRFMLQARRVPIHPIPSSCIRQADVKFQMMCVDSFDVDTTVEWYANSETLNVASVRTGYSSSALKRMLAAAGIPVPQCKRNNFRRILRTDIDRAVLQHMNLREASESIDAAAKRTRISAGTLSIWLRQARVIGEDVHRPFDVAPADVDRVVDARAWWRKRGESLMSAARRHKVHTQTMARWLEESGITPVAQGRTLVANKYRLDPALVDEVVSRKRTASQAEAAE